MQTLFFLFTNWSIHGIIRTEPRNNAQYYARRIIMYKCEREDEIMALLADTEYATVEYLVKKINISASSIRRDLKNLEERGLVVRSYGGVKLAESTGKHVPFP